MDDAYTIGITLALENGVSEGLAIIRRDLDTVNLALAQTMRGFAGVRGASGAAIGGAGLDLKRLAAEGQRILGRQPSNAVSPEPKRVIQRPITDGDASALPTVPMPAGKAAPVSSTPNLPGPTVPLHPAAKSKPATVPIAAAPATPIAAAQAAPGQPVQPPRLRFELPTRPALSAPLPSPANPAPMRLAPLPRANSAPMRPAPAEWPANAAPVPPHAMPLRPVRVVPTGSARVPPPTSAAPTPIASVQLPQASIGTTAPPAPNPRPVTASFAPITGSSPESTPGPLAPITRGLIASELAAFAHKLTPPTAPFSEPPMARLMAFAPATANQPARPMTSRQSWSGPADEAPWLPHPGGRYTDQQRIETAPRATPIRSVAPLPVPIATSAQPGPAPDLPQRASERSWTGSREATGPDDGNIYLDGHLVGRWMSSHLAREAGRPPAGPTGFDARASIIWPGAPIQS